MKNMFRIIENDNSETLTPFKQRRLDMKTKQNIENPLLTRIH